MPRNDVDRVVRGLAARELVRDGSLWMPRTKDYYALKVLPKMLWWSVLISFTTAKLFDPLIRFALCLIRN